MRAGRGGACTNLRRKVDTEAKQRRHVEHVDQRRGAPAPAAAAAAAKRAAACIGRDSKQLLERGERLGHHDP